MAGTARTVTLDIWRERNHRDADLVFFATGRKPNDRRSLGLDKVGVTTSAIPAPWSVDAKLRNIAAKRLRASAMSPTG